MATITGGFYFIGETVEIVGPYHAAGHTLVRRSGGDTMAIRTGHLTRC